MGQKYLIRLDDACPTMDRERWERMFHILEKYDIKPIIGIIPDNRDPMQMVDDVDNDFWQKARSWKEKKWTIALHGYDHVYISHEGGINPFWADSEFAGVPIEVQRRKIINGINILKDKGVAPTCFFAPSHTYDKVTLNIIKKETDIRIISDGVALKPYWEDGLCFVPQLIGHCVNMRLPGVYTFCFHPTMMSYNSFYALETFLQRYKEKFVGLDDLQLDTYGRRTVLDRLFFNFFFAIRYVKNKLRSRLHQQNN